MAQDATEIVIAPFGHVYTAPSGSVQPVTVTAAWDAAWVELGYTTDAGATLTPAITTVELNAWQASAPVKVLISGSSLDVAFALRQFNPDTSSMYFFGSSWTLSSGSTYVLSLVSSPPVNERMLGIEWGDGTTTNRLVVPRGMVSKTDAITLDRKEGTIFGITFTALDSAGILASILSNSSTLA